jgi:tetratricopeptide (TPR) repeat protein
MSYRSKNGCGGGGYLDSPALPLPSFPSELVEVIEDLRRLPTDEVDQQVRLWVEQAHEAYVERLIPRVIHYFERALTYADKRGLQREIALICRDLGYVYLREGALERALALLDRGLAAGEGAEVPVRLGLLANKASVLARRRSYRDSLALLEQAVSLIDGTYGSLAAAPSWLVHSDAGMRRMAADLRRVVELLDMGINPERLDVEIKSEEPPWLTKKS